MDGETQGKEHRLESGPGTGGVQARVGAGKVGAGDAKAVHARVRDAVQAGEADGDGDAEAVQAGEVDGRVRAEVGPGEAG